MNRRERKKLGPKREFRRLMRLVNRYRGIDLEVWGRVPGRLLATSKLRGGGHAQ